MAQAKQAIMQRIQVGVVGLVIVLLFVSMANVMNNRAVETKVAEGDTQDAAMSPHDEDGLPDEPMAELGVAPVTEDKPTKKDVLEAAPVQNNVQATTE